MRLLNTETLAFNTYFSDMPKYAILSHRWLPEGEITYKEFMNLLQRPEADWPDSMKKVKRFCEIARSLGIEWAWSDTCCINKDDPDELAESINSMWKWYADSEVCLTYLRDVPSNLTLEKRQEETMKSEWFTRGWTLQELLAPRRMRFFDQDWKPIGTRDELAGRIRLRTRIEPQYFGDLNEIKRASAAARLSWAAGRTVTRPEDLAFCLIGIMDIYMRPRYGRGQAEAFRVLQVKFTKKYRDQTIFAWKMPSASPNDHHGLLAPNPDAFATTGHFKTTKRSVWRDGWKVNDQEQLSGFYHTSHPVPWISTIKANLDNITISIDAKDNSDKVPCLRLRKINGVLHRVNTNELSLDGRSDAMGRSKAWGKYIIHALPVSWKKQLDIAL